MRFLLDGGLDPGVNPGVFGKLLDFLPVFAFFWLILSERSRKVKFFAFFWGFSGSGLESPDSISAPAGHSRARAYVRTYVGACAYVGAYVRAWGRGLAG